MHWTPKLIQQARELAAEGLTRNQVANSLGVGSARLAQIARENGFRFYGRRYQDRDARLANPQPRPPVDQEAEVAAARQNLVREIEEAKKEMAYAPLYKGGW